jgi:hypothetical protein
MKIKLFFNKKKVSINVRKNYKNTASFDLNDNLNKLHNNSNAKHLMTTLSKNAKYL